MAKMLTDAEEATEPLVCPNCESAEITAGHCNSDIGVIWRDAACDMCGQEWKEIFSFTKYEIKKEQQCS